MHSDKDFRQAITDEMISLMYLGTDDDFLKAKTLAWVLKKLDEEYPTIIHKDVLVKLNGDDFVVSEGAYINTEPGGRATLDITYDRYSAPILSTHTQASASPHTSPYFF